MAEYVTRNGIRIKATDWLLDETTKMKAEFAIELAFVTLERDNALADLKKAREELMDVVEGRI